MTGKKDPTPWTLTDPIPADRASLDALIDEAHADDGPLCESDELGDLGASSAFQQQLVEQFVSSVQHTQGSATSRQAAVGGNWRRWVVGLVVAAVAVIVVGQITMPTGDMVDGWAVQVRSSEQMRGQADLSPVRVGETFEIVLKPDERVDDLLGALLFMEGAEGWTLVPSDTIQSDFGTLFVSGRLSAPEGETSLAVVVASESKLTEARARRQLEDGGTSGRVEIHHVSVDLIP
jgi:hypothetical protein